MNAAPLFSRIETILYDPPVTPAEFCLSQPCVNIRLGGASFVLNQPTSTAIVYALGVLWIAAGVYFIRSRAAQKSRFWWGVSLVLGGVAALSAGTSYQAFGYEIKCAGRQFCMWTSWWEIAYLALQAASMDAMLIAISYSCASGRLRKALIAYAWANAAVHLAVTAAGAFTPVKFMISFELMILFAVPSLVIFFILSGARYLKYKEHLDRTLLVAGVLLVITTGAYYSYMTMGVTQKLWSRNIWFSDNDVLHVFMAGWIIYIASSLGKLLKDAPAE